MKARAQPGRSIRIAGLMAGLLLLTSGYLWLLGAGGPVIGGPFALMSSNGQRVTDRSFPGQFLLIYFGYTRCEDICPTTLASVADALDSLGTRAKKLQPLFISIDPARDTPAIAANYAARFSPRLLGLSGNSDEIAQVARRYHVGSTLQHHPERIDHTSVLYLVAPNGRYLAAIPANESGQRMAHDLAGYLS